MAVITLRSVKGSPLTNAEVDANFSNLNAEIATKLDTSAYTAADVLTKIKTVDGVGSGLDADLLDGLNTATAATINTIVTRDASANFAGNVITAASFVGPLTGNVTGNASGTAANVTGVVAIVNGGTGGTTVATAQAGLQVDPAGTALALAIALG